ncbi:MAG: NAD(P)H-hydrate dehydratase, partial [Kingella oralis]
MMVHIAPPNIAPYRAHAQQYFPSLLNPRPNNSHKGTFGTVGVVGGGEGMAGAALLAGIAALQTGCGKVFIGFNQATPPSAAYAYHPELMLDTAVRTVQRDNINTWVVGCGLGQNESAARALHAVWNSDHPQLVLDADALHLLVNHPKLFPPAKHPDLVLTPHPGEAAHLLDVSTSRVQSNRAWAAREIANRYRAWCILKGHETVISSARGFLHVNKTGNAGLATAGSGDVLSGIVGSLLAQGMAA